MESQRRAADTKTNCQHPFHFPSAWRRGMCGLLCLRSSLTLLRRLKVWYASGDKRAFVHLRSWLITASRVFLRLHTHTSRGRKKVEKPVRNCNPCCAHPGGLHATQSAPVTRWAFTLQAQHRYAPKNRGAGGGKKRHFELAMCSWEPVFPPKCWIKETTAVA